MTIRTDVIAGNNQHSLEAIQLVILPTSTAVEDSSLEVARSLTSRLQNTTDGMSLANPFLVSAFNILNNIEVDALEQKISMLVTKVQGSRSELEGGDRTVRLLKKTW